MHPDVTAMTKIRNPVAKHGRQFNKAQVFEDHTRYVRHEKHRVQRRDGQVKPRENTDASQLRSSDE